MKYTTKSGKELPPEVAEVIEKQPMDCDGTWGLMWHKITQPLLSALQEIWIADNFTEFYKLYPKKDLDSYGNEIVKGEMVHYADCEDFIHNNKGEFLGIAEKSKRKYLVYVNDYSNCVTWKFCRKINTNESKKSELESQMNDLLTKANELKQKINEL